MASIGTNTRRSALPILRLQRKTSGQPSIPTILCPSIIVTRSYSPPQAPRDSSSHQPGFLKPCSPTPRSAKSNTKSSTSLGKSKPPNGKKNATILVAVIACAGLWLAACNAFTSRKKQNRHRLRPFTIIDKTPVSPTCFLLTVEEAPTLSPCGKLRIHDPPPHSQSHHDPLPDQLVISPDSSWEIVQPQLQIVRAYTPLPRSLDPDSTSRRIRFFIRVYPKGETSRYLDSLEVGSEIRMRPGPPAFRAEDEPVANHKVVFLAGGTGITAALHAAESLGMRRLEEERPGADRLLHDYHALRQRIPEFRVVWCISDLRDAVQPVSSTALEKRTNASESISSSLTLDSRNKKLLVSEQMPSMAPNLMTQFLMVLSEKWSPKFSYAICPDVRPGRPDITPEMIYREMTGQDAPSAQKGNSSSSFLGWLGLWTKSASAQQDKEQGQFEKITEAERTNSNDTCSLHNSAVETVVHGSTEAPIVPFPPGKPKSLLVVSGPDGFVAAMAGPKTLDGKQGPVGGMIGEVLRKHPELSKEWNVLKI